jgi:dihydroorotase
MRSIKIVNAKIVNEGRVYESDVFIKNGFIDTIGGDLSATTADEVIDASGQYLLPGLIDDQVHFREPGLTHKADIFSESRAAVAGGITSYMEMPNTVPQTVTQKLLQDKYDLAAVSSLANYSFFMGTTNNNLEEIKKTDPGTVCGIKIFMGSSTGNMLVDDERALENIFREANLLIATHCEDEKTIAENLVLYKNKYGDDIPMACHPEIRSREACYKSSSYAVALAQKFKAQLHVLHISTQEEVELFSSEPVLADKRITAEACIHHMWFDDSDYASKGSLIKWNPAVKSRRDREAILAGVLNDQIDIIATDHAPHTLDEKSNAYLAAPSGGPLVQHALQAMFELTLNGKISLEKLVEKMCHNPAILFKINRRGFIREGYWADLVLLDPRLSQQVGKDNLLYKCGWSPFEGQLFRSQVTHTIVSGKIAYRNGEFAINSSAQRLLFDRS